MNTKKIEIELNQEDIELIKEINEIQNKIGELDSKKLNSDLMDAIKDKAIESIATVFGMSDVFEMRAHSNAHEADLEYKRYKEWKSNTNDSSNNTYKPKYLHKSEFDSVLETKKNIPIYNKQERKKLEGEEFVQAKDRYFHDEAPKYVEDGYTGEKINRFETVKKEKADLEHIEPLSQIHHDPVTNKYLSLEERRKFANSEENTTITKAGVNRSKGDINTDKVSDWADKNSERLGLNKDEINEKLKKSANAKKKILFDKKIQYKAKEQVEIAGKNAVKSAGKAVVGKLLSITVIEVIDLYKQPEELSLSDKSKLLIKRITEKSKDLLATFKDSAISSFIGTLVDALLNSIFKIAKNIFKFVKTAFNAILKSIKILFDSNVTKAEKMREILKVLGASLAVSIGFILDELIEKASVAVFPAIAPFVGYISPVISGFIVGIGSILLLQAFERHKDKMEYNSLSLEEGKRMDRLKNSAVIKANIADYNSNKGILFNIQLFQGVLPLIEANNNAITESLGNIKALKNNIETSIKKNVLMIDENNELLNELNGL